MVVYLQFQSGTPKDGSEKEIPQTCFFVTGDALQTAGFSLETPSKHVGFFRRLFLGRLGERSRHPVNRLLGAELRFRGDHPAGG